MFTTIRTEGELGEYTLAHDETESRKLFPIFRSLCIFNFGIFNKIMVINKKKFIGFIEHFMEEPDLNVNIN